MIFFSGIKSDMFLDCKKPFQLRPDLQIQFVPRYCIGDHSYLCKSQGNASSGHFRCFACAEDFSLKEEPVWKPKEKMFKKSLKDIVEYLKKNKAGDYGIEFIPGILKDDLETDLESRNLSEYELVHDVLHNVLGSEKNIYECFTKENGFDKEGSKFAIEELLGREMSQGLNGGKYF